MTSNRLRAGIIIGLIALCSALAGAAVERSVFQKMIARRRPPPLAGANRLTPEADTRRRTETLDRMTKDLTLTPTQRAGIDSVMQHSDSLLRGIRMEIQPRLEQVLAASRAAIDARLDPQQREKYEAMVAERRGGRRSASNP
jgi:Spy/CpxP family protein refolding chaperone